MSDRNDIVYQHIATEDGDFDVYLPPGKYNIQFVSDTWGGTMTAKLFLSVSGLADEWFQETEPPGHTTGIARTSNSPPYAIDGGLWARMTIENYNSDVKMVVSRRAA